MFFSPLQSKLGRLVGHGESAAAVAARTWTADPAHEIDSPVAIYDPEEMLRVTGVSAHSSTAAEMARLQRQVTPHRATVVSELRDVVMCGGNLYAGAYKLTMRDKRRLLARVAVEIDDGGVPCSTWLGGLYFGHWLAEDTAMKLLVEPFGVPTEVDQPQTAHQAGYNELFGIRRRLLPDVCLIRRVTIVESDLVSRFLGEGWSRMTAAIAARYPGPPHIGCMLLRGTTGLRRMLINEAEVAERLRALGFRIIDPATTRLNDILAAASGSRIVVGVEGSQLAHGFHCLNRHGAMLVLQPPNRFGSVYKERCDLKGARYAFTVGYQEENAFRIDIDGLQRTLDRLIDVLRPMSAEGLG